MLRPGFRPNGQGVFLPAGAARQGRVVGETRACVIARNGHASLLSDGVSGALSDHLPRSGAHGVQA